MAKKLNIIAAYVFVFLLFLFTPIYVFTQEGGNSPISVSPGSDTEVTTVSQSCPTFSWSSVELAASYRIVVFKVSDGQWLSYEDMATVSSPLISKEIAGAALSWTLPAEESLQTGNIYIWYVLAIDSFGNALGLWSEGKIFKVEQEIAFAWIEGQLEEILKSYGVSDKIITNTMKDLKKDARYVQAQGAVGENIPKRSGVQGYEGEENTFYGLNAGYNNTSGYYNSLFGNYAGFSNSDGFANSFFGNDAGRSNTSGGRNSFFGFRAGYRNTTGFDNTFIGQQTGDSNVTGFENSFVGYGSGFCNQTGYYNSFFGACAGRSNLSGWSNSFFGYYAGSSNKSGVGNSYFGYGAGGNNITGSINIFLGYLAGNKETGSNKLYIANSDTNTPLIYGEFDNKILTVNGKLGINTSTPGYTIEANATGSNACLVVKRTDGATNYINATATYANFGSTTNHPLRLVANNAWRMVLNTDNSLSMASGATCTIGGVWTNASSRALKENIETLSTAEAVSVLTQLTPVKYNYKTDQSDQYLGFIAEDVPELVATTDRKGLSPMDITAVLTKVVQEQQRVNQEQQKLIVELQQRIVKLENKK